MTITKKQKGCLIGCLTPVVLLLALIGLMCIPSNPVKVAEGLLRIELPNGTKAVSSKDTGLGLPIPGGASDGYTWLILQVPPNQLTNFAQKVSTVPFWKRLPLPPELAAGEKYLQPTIMDGVKGQIPLETARGYYILIDQQVEWNQRVPPPRPPYQTNTPIWERPSMDYIFGVFDETTGRVYVWSVNT
jgi:hypothetical protein